MQCEYVNEKQERCNGYAMNKSKFCFAHNKEAKERHLEAVKKGGQATHKQDYIQLDPIHIEDALSTAYVITDTINRIRTIKPDGTMDLKVANSLGFLSGKLLECRKQLLYEESLLKNAICKDKKIDLATFRKLMQEYDQELDDTAGAVLEDARQRYEEHKKQNNGAYLF